MERSLIQFPRVAQGLVRPTSSPGLITRILQHANFTCDVCVTASWASLICNTYFGRITTLNNCVIKQYPIKFKHAVLNVSRPIKRLIKLYSRFHMEYPARGTIKYL